ncbi:MAG: 4-hydroxythreonine-4-phosphate dehydrogenase PdxA [Candidatus Omnitrophota bacterium]|nr:4-hydroxythreonine-4-phosphate dehydrogenase PdxA [Candidatus Omnitrophota bacterium]
MWKLKKVRVGITAGDPAGIGSEIIIKALRKPLIQKLANFIIIGDRWAFEQVSDLSPQLSDRIRFIDLKNVNAKNFSFGLIKAKYGRASIEYLDKALELIKKREIDCLVTCPISKEAINLANFNFTGHTEYLAKRTNTKEILMMLLNKELKISLVTRHIPLKEVALAVKEDNLYKTIFMTNSCLKKLFLIKEPRIVVCGLNPHASDNGLIGEEDDKIIKPVLNKFKKQLRGHIDGPLSADVAVLKAKQKKYDGVIAIYHDQALIPLKLLDSKSGVNLTFGLPFIRTSPLHGTAFDIAGRGIASADSLTEAINLAVKCTLNLRKA